MRARWRRRSLSLTPDPCFPGSLPPCLHRAAGQHRLDERQLQRQRAVGAALQRVVDGAQPLNEVGDDRDNRDRFADVVAQGAPPGLVGYLSGDPVGWVQVALRSDFPTILRSRLVRPVDDVEAWSINCFVVRVGYRHKGVASGLAAAAVAYAKAAGASVVEAYPVDGATWSAADYYTGSLGMFLDLGFAEVTRRKATRPIVRLAV